MRTDKRPTADGNLREIIGRALRRKRFKEYTIKNSFKTPQG